MDSLLKFIHTGDIHLDSIFSEKDLRKSSQLRSELRQSFSDMVSYADKNDIKLILISGDLFDSEFVTLDTELFIKDMFASYPKIHFVIAPGNHDPLNDCDLYLSNVFPDNVHIFREANITCFELEDIGAEIYGYAFVDKEMNSNPIREYHPNSSDAVKILCCHGDIQSKQSKYCPISREDIYASTYNYIALGHIHNYSEGIKKEGAAYYDYCGCFAGRDFGECGEKGFKVVNISKGDSGLSVSSELINFSKHRYEKIEIDFSFCTDLSQAYELIKNETKDFLDTTVSLKVILSGVVPFEFELSEYRIKEMLEKSLFSLEIENKLICHGSNSISPNDITVKGEFLRLMEEASGEFDVSDEVASLAVKYGMKALYGNLEI